MPPRITQSTESPQANDQATSAKQSAQDKKLKALQSKIQQSSGHTLAEGVLLKIVKKAKEKARNEAQAKSTKQSHEKQLETSKLHKQAAQTQLKQANTTGALQNKDMSTGLTPEVLKSIASVVDYGATLPAPSAAAQNSLNADALTQLLQNFLPGTDKADIDKLLQMLANKGKAAARSGQKGKAAARQSSTSQRAQSKSASMRAAARSHTAKLGVSASLRQMSQNMGTRMQAQQGAKARTAEQSPDIKSQTSTTSSAFTAGDVIPSSPLMVAAVVYGLRGEALIDALLQSPDRDVESLFRNFMFEFQLFFRQINKEKNELEDLLSAMSLEFAKWRAKFREKQLDWRKQRAGAQAAKAVDRQIKQVNVDRALGFGRVEEKEEDVPERDLLGRPKKDGKKTVYKQVPDRNEDGSVKKDADGNTIYKNKTKTRRSRERHPGNAAVTDAKALLTSITGDGTDPTIQDLHGRILLSDDELKRLDAFGQERIEELKQSIQEYKAKDAQTLKDEAQEKHAEEKTKLEQDQAKAIQALDDNNELSDEEKAEKKTELQTEHQATLKAHDDKLTDILDQVENENQRKVEGLEKDLLQLEYHRLMVFGTGGDDETLTEEEKEQRYLSQMASIKDRTAIKLKPIQQRLEDLQAKSDAAVQDLQDKHNKELEALKAEQKTELAAFDKINPNQTSEPTKTKRQALLDQHSQAIDDKENALATAKGKAQQPYTDAITHAENIVTELEKVTEPDENTKDYRSLVNEYQARAGDFYKASQTRAEWEHLQTVQEELEQLPQAIQKLEEDIAALQDPEQINPIDPQESLQAKTEKLKTLKEKQATRDQRLTSIKARIEALKADYYVAAQRLQQRIRASESPQSFGAYLGDESMFNKTGYGDARNKVYQEVVVPTLRENKAAKRALYKGFIEASPETKKKILNGYKGGMLNMQELPGLSKSERAFLETTLHQRAAKDKDAKAALNFIQHHTDYEQAEEEMAPLYTVNEQDPKEPQTDKFNQELEELKTAYQNAGLDEEQVELRASLEQKKFDLAKAQYALAKFDQDRAKEAKDKTKSQNANEDPPVELTEEQKKKRAELDQAKTDAQSALSDHQDKFPKDETTNQEASALLNGANTKQSLTWLDTGLQFADMITQTSAQILGEEANRFTRQTQGTTSREAMSFEQALRQHRQRARGLIQQMLLTLQSGLLS